MAFGPSNRMENFLGCFTEKSYGHSFEYEVNREEDSWLPVSEYPHRVWVSTKCGGTPRFSRRSLTLCLMKTSTVSRLLKSGTSKSMSLTSETKEG